jgi:hypothetical protein
VASSWVPPKNGIKYVCLRNIPDLDFVKASLKK